MAIVRAILSSGTEYHTRTDIFTTPLPRERFNFLIDKIGMRSMSPETLKRLAEETEYVHRSSYAKDEEQKHVGSTITKKKKKLDKARAELTLFEKLIRSYIDQFEVACLRKKHLSPKSDVEEVAPIENTDGDMDVDEDVNDEAMKSRQIHYDVAAIDRLLNHDYTEEENSAMDELEDGFLKAFKATLELLEHMGVAKSETKKNEQAYDI
ncbi:hypothetical protein Tco_0952103 [Tanacetum coccineum]|uniref:Uncharacterized protein n=1 Tax=Tanacetum coccineum TaxID=301880 RepID=A0ABQ5DWP7_9ASTR